MPTSPIRFSTTALAALVAGALYAAPAMAAPLLVTSAANSGPGTLRAALETASRSGEPQTIVVATAADIVIDTQLNYWGTEPIEIIGSGQTISTSEDIILLTISQGADATIMNLAFEGPGGFDIENRSELGSAAGKGIFVDLRDDQTGIVEIELVNVTVTGTAGHGIHVSDCTLADDCGGGSGGAGDGSPASIRLTLTGVTVADTAYGRFDADGVRVDERGEGHIDFVATSSVFSGIGADGIELDEGQAGDVRATIGLSRFLDNGGYCDPALLAAFMPAEPEGEFEPGEMMEDAIPGPVTGSPDDGCFERAVDTYDDGSVEEYEFAIDTDDGFDIDEAGPGSLFVTVTGSTMNGNLDEGFDFDEEGPGDITATYVDTTASGNTDDGYKHSEADDGNVFGLVSYSGATDNGGAGFVFEEEGDGYVGVAVLDSATSDNDDGETGLEVVQEDDGTGNLLVAASDIADGIEAEGVILQDGTPPATDTMTEDDTSDDAGMEEEEAPSE
jgi:hypothetical protein